MALDGVAGASDITGSTRDSTSRRMGRTCYRATVTSPDPCATALQRIHVSAAVIVDPEYRLQLVRLDGTTAFMQPGGKPDPGQSPSKILCCEQTAAHRLTETGSAYGRQRVGKEVWMEGRACKKK